MQQGQSPAIPLCESSPCDYLPKDFCLAKSYYQGVNYRDHISKFFLLQCGTKVLTVLFGKIAHFQEKVILLTEHRKTVPNIYLSNTLLKSPKSELEGEHIITQENLQLERANYSEDSVYYGMCLFEFNLHQLHKSLLYWSSKCQLIYCITLQMNILSNHYVHI